MSKNNEATNGTKPVLSAVKILAFECGGDVDYMVNISGRSGEELANEFRNNGGYHGNGKRWFKEWAIDIGYCREASDDELDVIYYL